MDTMKPKVVSLCGTALHDPATVPSHPLAQERERVQEMLGHWKDHARSFTGVVISDDGRVTLVSSLDSHRDVYIVLQQALENARDMAFEELLDPYELADLEEDYEDEDDGSS